MTLINGGDIVELLAYYRLVWISGRFGGGKTSLAFRLAQEYLDKGYKLVSNARCVWNDDMRDITIDKTGLHSVVILDEGGLEFKSSRQIEGLAAYARKMDVIYILPSFFPPTRAAQVVTIQPLFSLVGAGLPLIVYRWRVKLQFFQDTGSFLWWRPSEIYGIYSSQDPGARAAKIVGWLLEKMEAYRKSWDHDDDDELFSMEDETESDIMAEAANAISEAADGIISISGRKNTRRKF